jgi:hypothetical protein
VPGRDVAPDEPESRWEQRHRILDWWTAIILAVAAVAPQTAATQQTIIDSQRWLQWVNAVDAGQKARADFLDNTML